MRPEVVRRRVPGWIDPESVFLAVLAEAATADPALARGAADSATANVFWLDSGTDATEGSSWLGVGSRRATWMAGETVAISAPGAAAVDTGLGLFPFLEREVPLPDGTAAGAPVGWVGWIGYGARAESLGVDVERSTRHPDAAFLFADRVVELDHRRRTVHLVGLDGSTGLEQWFDRMSRALVDPPPRPTVPPPPVRRASWRESRATYLDRIAECRLAIRDGEAYQLCLTTEAVVAGAIDPVAVYLALRRSSATHHGGFLRIGGVSLASASPETFLRVDANGAVESKPIKGTRPRSSDPAADGRLADELAADPKERAENLMIVDLVRNDLSRVSRLGSVEVPSLLAVESYPHVHQLVSTVRSALDAHPIDAVRAMFPAGSMTGAPKRRAVELLAELEGRERGLYSGAFGYLAIDGTIDLAMTIRSIVIDADAATVGAGGGITWSSDPEAELAEVRLKAAALLAVLGVDRVL